MIEVFETLGRRVEDEWRRSHHDEAAFPSLAAALLEELAPYRAIDPLQIVRWVFTTRELTPQVNIDSSFGEPPIAVYRGDRFYIEALFWLDGTTTIHQHGFCGAFQVLAGSSLHCQFAFDVDARINQRLLLGALELRQVELLPRGATRRIDSGEQFIHSLFHLDRPSVSLVVRTVSDDLGRPQFNYLKPGIAFDPYHQPEGLRKRLQLLVFLGERGTPITYPLLDELLRDADPETVLRALMRNAAYLDKRDFVALVERLSGDPQVAALLAILVPALAERERQDGIVERRKQVRDPDHRFLLGLLLNVTERQQLLELVAARVPDRPPAEVVAAWLAQLSMADPFAA